MEAVRPMSLTRISYVPRTAPFSPLVPTLQCVVLFFA